MPVSDLLALLSHHLVRLGPGVLFVVCLLETALFAGLILPVGALIAFAAMLASRGLFDPTEVALVALAGAFIGDQLGFVVGRWFVLRAQPPRGEIATLWGTALRKTEALVRSRGFVGIAAARPIPFVRTIMPWFAGRSGVPWSRFVLYDTIGIILWGAIYIGGGFLAGESWRQIASRYGEEAGAILVVAGIVIFALLSRGWLGRILARRRNGTPRSDHHRNRAGRP
jgi:membrane-associated protein